MIEATTREATARTEWTFLICGLVSSGLMVDLGLLIFAGAQASRLRS